MWLEGIEISVPDLVSMTRMDTSKMPVAFQNVQKSIQGIYKIIFDTIDGFFDEHIQVNNKFDFDPNQDFDPHQECWWIHGGEASFTGWSNENQSPIPENRSVTLRHESLPKVSPKNPPISLPVWVNQFPVPDVRFNVPGISATNPPISLAKSTYRPRVLYRTRQHFSHLARGYHPTHPTSHRISRQ